MKEYFKVAGEVVEGLKKMDTTSVSDAMDRLGIPGGLLGIKPVCQGTAFCGTAFTVHYVPVGQEKGSVGDFLDDVKPGEVCVLDNNGRVDCTVWGDLMSLYASRKGIAGTVINGVCRDLPGIRELKYPIFTKDYYMVTGKDRVWCDAVNIPVNVGGQQVKPGDVLLGDDTGVVRIPSERAEEVLKAAQEIEAKEQIIVSHVKAGKSLRDARKETGYHNLQTHQE